MFFKKLVIFACFLMLLNACSKTPANSEQPTAQTTSSASSAIADQQQKSDAYYNVEWIELMPKDDLQALLNPPAYLYDIEDGSEEDQISSQLSNTIAKADDDVYQQALNSTRVIDSFNNKLIRIPGFIVPLAFDQKQQVTEFFLVPYFGACIHVPPPPPNQIIFARFAKGKKVSQLYDAFILTGKLKTELIENNMARAAYVLDVHGITPFYDDQH